MAPRRSNQAAAATRACAASSGRLPARPRVGATTRSTRERGAGARRRRRLPPTDDHLFVVAARHEGSPLCSPPIFGFVILLGVLLCAFSNQITSGQCRPVDAKEPDTCAAAPPPPKPPRPLVSPPQSPRPQTRTRRSLCSTALRNWRSKPSPSSPTLLRRRRRRLLRRRRPRRRRRARAPGAAWLASQEAAEAAPATDERV